MTEEVAIFTYNLTTLIEVMNYVDIERNYTVSRSYEFSCEDDEDAISTAAGIFRKIMRHDGETFARIDVSKYCVIGIMNATLGYVNNHGQNEIVTSWRKSDFDNEGVMNYGSMDRDTGIGNSYANTYPVWTQEMIEEARLKRETEHQAFCNRLQNQTMIYLAMSKTGWKDKVRS